MHDPFKTLSTFRTGDGTDGYFHSIPALENSGVGPISRLPVSIRIVLESVLRNCDGKGPGNGRARPRELGGPRAGGNPVRRRANCPPGLHRVPLLVDLAAMRSRSPGLGADPK